VPRTLLAPAVRWTAAVLVNVALATACDGSSARTATVPVDRVTGVWKSGKATLALTADHTFTASGLNEGKLTDTGCPVGHADGDWAFFADQGDGLYVTSQQARSGSEIGLSFTEPSDEPCRLPLTVVDDDDTLCVMSDPDVTCDLGVRFTHER
jgi:hypothetical protein